ncbi:MAG TPA: SDR family oxidoreductase [Acidimicrobiales bacterium]
MRVFMTGASGWIGSAVIPELLSAGHQVTGLARSDASAAAIAALGADAFRGSLDDPSGLRDVVATSDGVIHLGYNHDFSQMQAAADTDRGVVEAIGSVLKGSDRPFVVAGGVIGIAPGRMATENDQPDPGLHPRTANVDYVLSLANDGVRSSCVRFAPTVHGEGDHGFIATLVAIARERGTSGYVGDGSNCWPAVHRADAARLVRLALEGAPAGSSLHAVAESGIPTKAIARAIGTGLGLPIVAVARDDAAEHFGWMGRFFGANATASNTMTRELLGWNPTHQGLLEDLAAGFYFR